MQWAEPVTGSSSMPAAGAKKRETKSQSPARGRDDQFRNVEGGDPWQNPAGTARTVSSQSMTAMAYGAARTAFWPRAQGFRDIADLGPLPAAAPESPSPAVSPSRDTVNRPLLVWKAMLSPALRQPIEQDPGGSQRGVTAEIDLDQRG